MEARPHILIIDDTPANLKTLAAVLHAEFDLQIATSGAEGLALATKSPPDMVLLDVMMPEMDGYETCRRLNAHPRTQTVPVIFITAMTGIEAESVGLALGAADYITKPINVDIARLRIRNLLERERLRKEVENQRNALQVQVERLNRMQLELAESEARYHSIIEASPVPFALNDEQQNIVYLNKAFVRTFGYDMRDIPTLADWWPKAYPDPDLRQWMAAEWQRHLAAAERNQVPFEPIEVPICCKDGTVRTVLTAAAPLGLSFRGVHLVTLYDISERKRAEVLLRDGEERLRLALGAARQGWFDVDLTTGKTNVSPEYPPIIGYAPEEFESDLQNWLAHVHPEDKDDVARVFQACAEDGGPYTMAYRRQTKSGEWKWIESVGKIVAWDANRRAARMIGIHTDITERKQTEAELEQHRHHLEALVFSRTAELAAARDAAEAASRAKSVFLANMSHELRTPMNGIMGMTDLALRRTEDPRLIDWLGKSKASAQHLLAVINDILDISKIEADRLTLDEKDFAPIEVIEDALHMQDEAAVAKGLALCREMDPAVPGRVCGDAMRLKQIVLNYVSNAIKFSERGRITVRVSVVEQDTHSVLLRIEVNDQGIGISPEQQQRLFHAFTQADDSDTRKYGGTGLGLIISKRIALLMGGGVGVSSAAGQGSNFWATVRLRRALEAPQADSAAPTEPPRETLARLYRGTSVLLVEDEPVNREVMLFQLEDAGLAVDIAVDGGEALAKASRGNHALILMDIQMPVMNGLEATRAIRQIPGKASVPILALTANAFDTDRERCLAAGMNDHIGKPVDPDVLCATVLHWLQASAVPPHA